MESILLLLYLLMMYICEVVGKKIILNAIASSFDDTNKIYNFFADEFNKYSEDNQLNIKINLNLLTGLNSTNSIKDYGTMIDALFQRRSKKYDIYFYDNLYTMKFGKNLVNLKNYLSNEFLSRYNEGILKDTCFYNDKLVGLPAELRYTVLYVNEKYLKKYKKNIPETWSDLIETTDYIVKQERSLNNTELLGFNGLFNDETGIYSIFEMIYSFRKDADSPFPGFSSKEAANALEMIKKIKDTIASDSIFKSNDVYTVLKLFDGSGLFLKYWLFNYPNSEIIDYKPCILPGWKKGVSAGIVSGFNMGVNKYSNRTNIDAAIEFIKFITATEYQKEKVKENLISTAITSLYDDEEVCQKVDCNFYKNLQPLGRFNNQTDDIDTYYERTKSIVYEYIYGNKTVNEVLKNAEDLTKIYTISINTKDSLLGLIMVIIVITTIIIMMASLIFLFMENFSPFFEFLPIDFWILVVIGSILVLSICMSQLGTVTNFKCQFKPLLLSIGNTFILVPLLYRLIINLPVTNSILTFIEKHKYLFLFFFLFTDIFFNGLSLIKKYTIKTIYILNGENFQICNFNGSLRKQLRWFNIIDNLVITVSILVLSFLEWNIQSTFYDIRLVISAIYIHILSYSIYFFLDFIEIDSYKSYYMIRTALLLIMSISDYSFLYGYRLVKGIFKRQNLREQFINNINKNFVNNNDNNIIKSSCYDSGNSIDQSNNNNNNNNNDNNNGNILTTYSTNNMSQNEEDSFDVNVVLSHRASVFSKILSFHYTTEAYSGNENEKSDSNSYEKMN